MAKQPETKVKFSIFNKEFNKGIQEMSKESTTLRKEFKLQEEQLKQNGTETEKFDAKLDHLNKQHELTEKKVKETATQLSKAKEYYGENSVEAQKLSDTLLNFQIAQQKLENQISSTTKQQSKYEDSLKNLQRLFDATGTDAKDLANLLGPELTESITKGQASTKDLEKAFQKLSRETLGADQDLNKVRKTLSKLDDGASIKAVRKDLNKLSKEASDAKGEVADLGSEITNLAAGAAAGAGVAGSVEQALELSSLQTKIDITFEVPEESKEVIKQSIKNIMAYGIDAESALEGVRRQWVLNKEVADETNNQIVRGAGAIAASYNDVDFTELIQETNEIAAGLNISNDNALALTNALLKAGFPPEQIDTIAEYGQQMKNAGFNAQEVQAIFEAGINTKTWNIDNLNDGVKEARIRMAEFGQEVPKAMSELLSQTDMSVSQFQALGSAVAEGGTKGSQAMSEMATFLDGIEDKALKNALASQVFGTMWEDQGQNMIAVFQGVSGAVDKTKANADGLQQAIGNLNTDPAVQLQQAFVNLKTALEPVLLKVADIISKIATWISENPKLAATITMIVSAVGVLTGVVMGLTTLLGSLAAIASFLGLSLGAIAAPIAIAVAAIAALIAIGVALFQNWDKISALANATWSTIGNLIKISVTKIISTIGNLYSETLKRFQSIKSSVPIVISSLLSSVSLKFLQIKDAIISPITSAKDKVLGIISLITGAFSRMKISIPKPKLPKIDISTAYKKIGGLSIPYPDFDVTWHKTGGVFTKPVVAGNAGFGDVEEGIVPFEGAHAMKIAKLIATAQNKLGGVSQHLADKVIQNEVKVYVEPSPIIADGRSIGKVSWRTVDEYITRNNARP